MRKPKPKPKPKMSYAKVGQALAMIEERRGPFRLHRLLYRAVRRRVHALALYELGKRRRGESGREGPLVRASTVDLLIKFERGHTASMRGGPAGAA